MPGIHRLPTTRICLLVSDEKLFHSSQLILKSLLLLSSFFTIRLIKICNKSNQTTISEAFSYFFLWTEMTVIWMVAVVIIITANIPKYCSHPLFIYGKHCDELEAVRITPASSAIFFWFFLFINWWKSRIVKCKLIQPGGVLPKGKSLPHSLTILRLTCLTPNTTRTHTAALYLNTESVEREHLMAIDQNTWA